MCSVCGIKPVWKNGKCKYHDDTRKPIVSTSNLKSKNTPLKKRSSLRGSPKRLKQVSENRKECTEWGYDNQSGMFLSLWENAKKNEKVYSEISNFDITWMYDTQLWSSCFAHILAKGSYPKFKLNPKNIMIVDPYEHLLIDQGTEKQRKDYEKKHHCTFDIFYKKKDKLKEEYKAFQRRIT